MPPVLAIGAGALVAGAAIGGAIGAALIGVGLSLAANYAASLLAGKPDAGAAFSSSVNVTSSASDDVRPVIYGRTTFGGTRIFDEVTGDGKYLHRVIVYAAHEIDAFEQILVDGEALTLDEDGNETGTYAGYMRIKKHLGAWDQAADADLVAECPSWTSEHRLRGLAYLYVRLTYNPDLFSDVPDFLPVIRGRKLYDPREEEQDPDDPATWAWSDNAALCALDYMRGVPAKDGAGNVRRLLGLNATDDFIAMAEFAAEAGICDETVTLAEGGTEKRYTANGVITDSEPETALTQLLSAAWGQRIDAGGVLSLRVAAARTPSLDLTEDDLIAPASWQPYRPLDESFNGVKGKYRGPDTNYEIADIPPYQDDALVANDGREAWMDLTLPFTDTAARGQRVQRLALAENRREATGTLPLTLKGLRLQAGDWFTFTSARRGWKSKVFRVRKTGLAHVTADDAPFLSVTLTVEEIDAGAYDWSSADQAIVLPAPSTNLPNPLLVPPPIGLAAQVVEFRDRALVSLTATPAGGGPTVKYQFDWKPADASEFTRLPDSDEPQRSVYLDVGQYKIRVRAVALPYGGRSAWVPSDAGQDFTVGNPPLTPRVTGLELVNGGLSGIFTGPDAQCVWREGSYYAPGLDNPLGADAFQRDPYFDGYRVTVTALTGETLRVSKVYDPAFTYTLDMNRRDSSGVLGLGPRRSFRVIVQQIGRQSQDVEQSLPQTIEVENPAPAAPTGLSVTAFSRSGWIDFSIGTDDGDLAGAILKGSTVSGFDPDSAGTVLYQGEARSRINYPLTPGETLYLRLALFDAFGLEDLNWSSEIAVTPQSIGTAEVSEEIQTLLANAAAVGSEYVVRVDAQGRIAGVALVGGSTVSAAWLVDQFQIVKPGEGQTPIVVFEVDTETGDVKLNSLFATTITTDQLKAVWLAADEIRGSKLLPPTGDNVVFDLVNETLEFKFSS